MGDNELNRKIAVAILSATGASVETAVNGKLAMTANAFAEERKKTEEAEMKGHLAKPIDIPLLMEVLCKWLK